MQKRCSNKVVTGMLCVQIGLIAVIFANMIEFDFLNIFNITNLTNLSYIAAISVILFAIGFFVFSFRACVCEHSKDKEHDSKCTHQVKNLKNI